MRMPCSYGAPRVPSLTSRILDMQETALPGSSPRRESWTCRGG
ncbi:hypothetical protein ACFPRL_13180 [Pseudoclavibacter helvolus]